MKTIENKGSERICRKDLTISRVIFSTEWGQNGQKGGEIGHFIEKRYEE